MDHLTKLQQLLAIEGRAEAEQTIARLRKRTSADAERTGRTLTALTVKNEELALGGRVVLTLGKRGLDRPLPWNRLAVGTPVLLSEEGLEDGACRGIVCSRDDRTIDVAFDRAPESESDRPEYRLDAAYDEAAQRRQKAALDEAKSLRRGRSAELRDVLLDLVAPSFGETQPIEPQNRNLNSSQREAVEFALSGEDFAVIHGPPGTGKTTTVVELIRQAIQRGERVLACAPSNVAVDNLLERLIVVGEEAVRLGHPARVSADLQEHTLDLLVDVHPDVRLARRLVKEAKSLRNRASKRTRAKPARGARRETREEASRLIADARRLEARAVTQVLDSADCLCSTLTGLDADLLKDRRFDLVVIDEAAQATEPACWIPILRGNRIVLAGDHQQLPPTIVSPEAARAGLSLSLMERLIHAHGSAVSRMLTVQYRMHEAIMTFPSSEFYEAGLVADARVERHLLRDLPRVAENELTGTPLEFIDTAGADLPEEVEPDGSSRLNVGEANVLVRRVEDLLDSGVGARQIAVIAPYAAQVRRLRELISMDGLEIDTVDGFQGREKEAVLISLVRSNPEGEIGFLSDVRRMNVALTRARRKLIVIGDSATVAHHEFYQRLIEYFEERGGYRTVWELD